MACQREKTEVRLSYCKKVEHVEEGVGVVVILEHVASRAEGDEPGKSKERGGKHFETSDCNVRLLQK